MKSLCSLWWIHRYSADFRKHGEVVEGRNAEWDDGARPYRSPKWKAGHSPPRCHTERAADPRREGHRPLKRRHHERSSSSSAATSVHLEHSPKRQRRETPERCKKSRSCGSREEESSSVPSQNKEKIQLKGRKSSGLADASQKASPEEHVAGEKVFKKLDKALGKDATSRLSVAKQKTAGELGSDADSLKIQRRKALKINSQNKQPYKHPENSTLDEDLMGTETLTIKVDTRHSLTKSSSSSHSDRQLSRDLVAVSSGGSESLAGTETNRNLQSRKLVSKTALGHAVALLVLQTERSDWKCMACVPGGARKSGERVGGCMQEVVPQIELLPAIHKKMRLVKTIGLTQGTFSSDDYNQKPSHFVKKPLVDNPGHVRHFRKPLMSVVRVLQPQSCYSEGPGQNCVFPNAGGCVFKVMMLQRDLIGSACPTASKIQSTGRPQLVQRIPSPGSVGLWVLKGSAGLLSGPVKPSRRHVEVPLRGPHLSLAASRTPPPVSSSATAPPLGLPGESAFGKPGRDVAAQVTKPMLILADFSLSLSLPLSSVEAIVEFDYKAQHDDELTIAVGDIISNIRKDDGGWWEGEISGRRGLFPDNFVREIKKDVKKEAQGQKQKGELSNGSPSPASEPSLRPAKKGEAIRKRRCKAAFSYVPQNEDELELKIGDIIEVLAEVEEGWWEGTLNGRTGMFPSNFIRELPLEPDDPLTPQEEARSTRTSVKDSTGSESDGGDSSSTKSDGGSGSLYTRIQPKKVKGFGFGDIFKDQPIKLRPRSMDIDSELSLQEKLRGPAVSWSGDRPSARPGHMLSELSACGACSDITVMLAALVHCCTSCGARHAHSSPGRHRRRLRVSHTGHPSPPGSADVRGTGMKKWWKQQVAKKVPPAGAPQEAPARSEPDSKAKAKEYCKVIFPYEAQNEDELTIKEGDIVAIVSKECGDAGWWLGELNGRQGVFPDNFVKLLAPDVEKERPKKPPPPAAPVGKHSTDKKPEVKKVPPDRPECLPHRGEERGTALPAVPAVPPKKPLPPKTNSLGRPNSFPPKRPERPAVPNIRSESPKSDSVAGAVQERGSSDRVSDIVTNESFLSCYIEDFDSIVSTAEKLNHPTASRPRVTDRRPRSQIFTSSSLSSPDLLDSPSPEEDRKEKEEQDSPSPKALDTGRKAPKPVPVLPVPESKTPLPPKPGAPPSSSGAGNAASSLHPGGPAVAPRPPSPLPFGADAKPKNDHASPGAPPTMEELRSQLRDLRGIIELMKTQHKYGRPACGGGGGIGLRSVTSVSGFASYRVCQSQRPLYSAHVHVCAAAEPRESALDCKFIINEVDLTPDLGGHCRLF
ncbi:SH3K1 protein, partial [Atractosteus spatula]|nr:SH3K1 protein [Atractosteus spatula]